MISHFFKIFSDINHKAMRAKIIYICFISYEKTLTFITMTYLRVISTRCRSTCTLRRARNFLYLSSLNFRFFLVVRDFVDARPYNNNMSFFDSFESTLKTTSKSIFSNTSFSFSAFWFTVCDWSSKIFDWVTHSMNC